MATLELIVDGLLVTREGFVPNIAYKTDFAGLTGDRTQLAENIAARMTLAEVRNRVRIKMTHLDGVSSGIAGADTAPRVSIALSDLLTDYSQGRLTLALAATGSATAHQVQIAQMRVIEV